MILFVLAVGADAFFLNILKGGNGGNKCGCRKYTINQCVPEPKVHCIEQKEKKCIRTVKDECHYHNRQVCTKVYEEKSGNYNRLLLLFDVYPGK